MTAKRGLALSFAAAALALSTLGASSCDKTQKDLNKAERDLNKASQGLDALTATCKQLRNNPKAARSFDRNVAQNANRSDEPLSRTIEKARASRKRHCAQSQNSTYQPYTDVSADISP
jgi:septal ring factor EnvC (AmiA/AmiB activator)